MFFHNYSFVSFRKNLLKLDNEVRDQHLSVASRIYAVFESIHRYAAHLKAFLQDLKDGTFLHTSTESVFTDYDGKQLMVCITFFSDVILLYFHCTVSCFI